MEILEVLGNNQLLFYTSETKIQLEGWKREVKEFFPALKYLRTNSGDLTFDQSQIGDETLEKRVILDSVPPDQREVKNR